MRCSESSDRRVLDAALGADEQLLALARAYISTEQYEFARFILTMAEKIDEMLGDHVPTFVELSHEKRPLKA